MGNNLVFALQISGIGIVVLLLVLTALAGIVYLMTRFIVDKEEKEEVAEEKAPVAEAAAVEDKKETKTDLKLAAAIAVAIARAQAEMQVVSTETEGGEINAWRQFGLQRRLTQSSTFRRTR